MGGRHTNFEDQILRSRDRRTPKLKFKVLGFLVPLYTGQKGSVNMVRLVKGLGDVIKTFLFLQSVSNHLILKNVY